MRIKEGRLRPSLLKQPPLQLSCSNRIPENRFTHNSVINNFPNGISEDKLLPVEPP